MESLRWVLLAGGIVFVIVIYILGRSRRRRSHSMVDELEDDFLIAELAGPALEQPEEPDLDQINEAVNEEEDYAGNDGVAFIKGEI